VSRNRRKGSPSEERLARLLTPRKRSSLLPPRSAPEYSQLFGATARGSPTSLSRTSATEHHRIIPSPTVRRSTRFHQKSIRSSGAGKVRQGTTVQLEGHTENRNKRRARYLGDIRATHFEVSAELTRRESSARFKGDELAYHLHEFRCTGVNIAVISRRVQDLRYFGSTRNSAKGSDRVRGIRTRLLPPPVEEKRLQNPRTYVTVNLLKEAGQRCPEVFH